MNGERKQRLFFALWPNDALREELLQIMRRFQVHAPGRPVTPENLHLTLSFLGYITAECRQCLEAVADQMTVEPFTLRFDRAGYWSRPRVVWLGCRETPAALQTVATGLNAGLTACGLKAEQRPYAPHLTLLRKVAPPQGRALVASPEMTAWTPVEWPVRGFVLVESVLHPRGAMYRVVNEWAFPRSA